MADLVWLILMLIVSCSVLGVLHVTAASVRNQVHMHQLNHRVNRLREIMAARVRDRGGMKEVPSKKAA